MKSIISSNGTETDFSKLKDPVPFLDSIRKREISIEEARHKQEEFNRHLKKKEKKELEINLKNKINKTLANINKLFNGRNDAIKFLDDYGSMIIEATKKAVKEPTKTKTKHKKSPCYMHEKFINEIENDYKKYK